MKVLGGLFVKSTKVYVLNWLKLKLKESICYSIKNLCTKLAKIKLGDVKEFYPYMCVC